MDETAIAIVLQPAPQLLIRIVDPKTFTGQFIPSDFSDDELLTQRGSDLLIDFIEAAGCFLEVIGGCHNSNCELCGSK